MRHMVKNIDAQWYTRAKYHMLTL